MRDTPKWWKKGLKIVALAVLPIALFWIIYTRHAEQAGPLIIGTNISEVGEPVDLLAFESDGQKLRSFTSRDTQLWDIKTKQKLHTRPLGEQHSFPASSPPFLSADAQTLITADRDNFDRFYVKLWDVQSGQLKRSLRVSDSMQYQRNAALSVNGILATHNWPKQGQDARGMSFGAEIKIWNARTGALLKLISLPGLTSQGSTTVSSLALSPDGTTVVAGFQEGDISVWDARSGREIGKWKDGSADIKVSESKNSRAFVVPGVGQVALSPNAKIVATASGDDTVRLWEPRTGKLLRVIKTPTGQNQPPLVFSPDSKWLASAGTRLQITYTGNADLDGRVWNVQTGELHARLKGHSAEIKAFAFSPDSALLVSGDAKGAIKLWPLS